MRDSSKSAEAQQASAPSSEFQPDPSRAQLQRSLGIWPLEIRRFQVAAYKVFLGFTFVFSVMMGWVNWTSTGFFVLITMLLGCAAVALYFGFMMRLSSTRFEVSRFGFQIIRDGPLDPEYHEFENVESISFWSIPGLYGSFKMKMKNGSSVSIPPILQRSDYILDLLVIARPDFANTKGLEDYRRTAIAIDHSWTRLAEKMMNWPSWMASGAMKWFAGCGLAFSIALTMQGHVQSDLPFLIFVCIADVMFLVIATGFALEYGLTLRQVRKLEREPSAVRRDREDEVRWSTRFSRAAWVFVLFGSMTAALVEGARMEGLRGESSRLSRERFVETVGNDFTLGNELHLSGGQEQAPEDAPPPESMISPVGAPTRLPSSDH